MKKIYIVMEYHNSKCSSYEGDPDDLASRPRRAFSNKDDAQKYADELNKTEESSCDDDYDDDDREGYKIEFRVVGVDIV